jgi:hypothetical protein
MPVNATGGAFIARELGQRRPLEGGLRAQL